MVASWVSLRMGRARGRGPFSLLRPLDPCTACPFLGAWKQASSGLAVGVWRMCQSPFSVCCGWDGNAVGEVEVKGDEDREEAGNEDVP